MSKSNPEVFPVACLGGSAGGLQPYTQVIRQLSPDPGMAIVVVNHFRKRVTKLPAILASHTSLPVVLITAGMKVERNHIYVNPSNRDLTIRDGFFQVSPLSQQFGWPTVISVFLESLARDWKGRVIAVLLSGLDSDGVRALQKIKAAGGTTFAQKIATAEHPSMPTEAVATGGVDFELTPAQIGKKLEQIAREELRKMAVQPNAPAAELCANVDPAECAVGGEGAPEIRPARGFPIVGVGSSAGGLEAVTLLLEHLPLQTGMAFVLVQHLDPTHESQLTEILSKKSSIPLQEVHGPTPVEPNHIYVMPANRSLIIKGGILETIPRPGQGTPNMPIDQFLESLAADQQHLAFGVILSGGASDGTLGIQAIKAEGGITFAQEPHSAKIDSMPRNAIASGTIDFVLSPEGIAKQLIELSRHSYVRAQGASQGVPADSRELDRMFVRLRTVTNIDFTYYKHNTILRRIKRRMMLHRMESLKDYARLVEQNRAEAAILAQDFLVNVTSFFREPELQAALRDIVFPTWLQDRTVEEPIRVWVPGCSTGEEAYSLAMALTEFLEHHGAHLGVQIFATDLSEAAVEKARGGVYLDSAVAGLSKERLERFFVKRDRVYQVSQAIRDLCVFAKHDVTRDPPFSRIDLISCCNLLIYLRPVLQKKALSLFHYALKPDGFLVLGSSESIGSLADSFETLDRKNKIFVRRGKGARPGFQLAAGNPGVIPAYVRPPGENPNPGTSVQKEAERMLLAEYAPASVIIDDAMHVLQVRGRTDPYLQVPQGAPTALLTAMVRPGLLAGLKTAVEKARKQNTQIVQKGLGIRDNNHFHNVDLKVSPIRSSDEKGRCFLVLFEESVERQTGSREKARKPKSGSESAALEQLQQEVARLEQELRGTRDYLQSIIETQEAATEELRSANEEAQANNEELDTAKEELQASNEELNTVNEELRIRNAEQNSLNSDLRKLLESINVPLVMVGKDLRIRWFTAAMEPVLNLLPNDQGRPITDLRATLIPDFMEMLVRALAGNQERNVEFQHPDGHWLSLRILPYRGPENTIDGAIATLIDIDDLKRARDFAEAVVETVREPLVVLDADLRIRTANDAFFKIFQFEKHETEGRLFYEIGSGQWNIPRLKELLEDLLPKKSALRDFEVEQHTDRATAKTMLFNAREIRQQNGERLILLAIDDITELRRTTENLRRTNEDLKQFIFAASHDLREPLRMIVAHTQLLAKKYSDKLDSQASVSMKYAVEGALRLEALISGLREFWELSERGQAERTLVDCNEVLRNVKLNLEALIAENGAVVTNEPLPSILASQSTLIQLFQNLLANALKYRSEAPPQIHIAAWREQTDWVFSFRDNGIGIDPQHARQIFGVFKRLHPPDQYSGTGIGLAICQKIVEHYGGRIWVESKTGEGSEFKFTIPS